MDNNQNPTNIIINESTTKKQLGLLLSNKNTPDSIKSQVKQELQRRKNIKDNLIKQRLEFIKNTRLNEFSKVYNTKIKPHLNTKSNLMGQCFNVFVAEIEDWPRRKFDGKVLSRFFKNENFFEITPEINKITEIRNLLTSNKKLVKNPNEQMGYSFIWTTQRGLGNQVFIIVENANDNLINMLKPLAEPISYDNIPSKVYLNPPLHMLIGTQEILETRQHVCDFTDDLFGVNDNKKYENELAKKQKNILNKIEESIKKI